MLRRVRHPGWEERPSAVMFKLTYSVAECRFSRLVTIHLSAKRCDPLYVVFSSLDTIVNIFQHVRNVPNS